MFIVKVVIMQMYFVLARKLDRFAIFLVPAVQSAPVHVAG